MKNKFKKWPEQPTILQLSNFFKSKYILQILIRIVYTNVSRCVHTRITKIRC